MLDGQSALFFNYVSSKCLNQVSLITISFSTPFPDNHTTIVNWDCAKDKKILCSHASVKWSEIKQKVIEKCDPSKTVRMQHFIKVKTTTNEDKEVTKVTATETNRSIQFILNFIDQLVSKMINHRDHLQVFDTQSSSKCYAVRLDVDFPENLSISVKYEPQSLHWSHEQDYCWICIISTDGFSS